MSTYAAQEDMFSRQLRRSQRQLFHFILNRIKDPNHAEDVLQNTNVRLWKNAHRFEPERSFIGWAISSAQLEIKAYYRDSKRDRHIFGNDWSHDLEQTSTCEPHQSLKSTQAIALCSCLLELRREHLNLLIQRDVCQQSIKQIAGNCNRSQNSVRSLLKRVRNSLRSSVRKRIRTTADWPH